MDNQKTSSKLKAAIVVIIMIAISISGCEPKKSHSPAGECGELQARLDMPLSEYPGNLMDRASDMRDHRNNC